MARRKRTRKSAEAPKTNEQSMEQGQRGDAAQPEAKSGLNDVSWYTRYPNLTLAGASFPYPYRPGMELNFGNITKSNGTTKAMLGRLPGVMSLSWVPSVGKSSKPTDPASILGKEMYARVRSAFSGTLRADAPDYVVYVMALDSIYSYIAWLKRLYRVLVAWTPENYVIPDHLLYGMGLKDADIQNLRAERIKLWQLINELVLQSRKFSCPGTLDIINRHYWMNDNVYADANSINSQLFMFNQMYAFKYSLGVYEEDGSAVGGCTAVAYPPYTHTLDKPLTAEVLYNFGRELIDALVEWDDAYTINGYLQRAYAGDPQFFVEEIAQNDGFNPVYAPEVLSQIENSVAVPFGYLCNQTLEVGFSFWQDPTTNAIISDPHFEVDLSVSGNNPWHQEFWKDGCNPFISLRSEAPGPLDNVIATRLKANWKINALENNKYNVSIDCATEIPLNWMFIEAGNGTYSDTTTLPSKLAQNDAIPSYIGEHVGLMGGSAFQKIFPMSQFDWHPIIILGSNSSSEEEFSCVPIGDVHNVTLISPDDLKNLHRICLFSEFNSFGMS